MAGYPQQNDQWYSMDANAGGGGWGQFDYSQNYAGSSYADPSANTANDYYRNTNMFIPTEQSNAAVHSTDDIENEPPLLEELGVDFDHIRQKTLAVLNPLGTVSVDVITDQDLAGPLVFCLLFGASLLLSGKVTFGYIYGIGLVGCVGMYALLNLMSAEHNISFTCTASVLGYCLLPMALLSLIAAVLTLQGIVGYVIATSAVFWCAQSSSKLFSIALSMEGQKLLVAYPCTLLYAVFALLAIF